MTELQEDQLEELPGALTPSLARRVVLLKTDERSGLVAEIASACHAGDISLEITTGPGHVLLTFEADGPATGSAVKALKEVPGVSAVHAYMVAGGLATQREKTQQ